MYAETVPAKAFSTGWVAPQGGADTFRSVLTGKARQQRLCTLGHLTKVVQLCRVIDQNFLACRIVGRPVEQ